MPDDWKTPSQPRLIGHLNDASGNSVAVSADRDAVVIRCGGQDIRLRDADRDPFIRLFMMAERHAEAYEGPASSEAPEGEPR